MDFLRNIGWPELLVIAGILAVWMIPALLTFVAMQRVPLSHRRRPAAHAWLLAIPLIADIWAFFMLPAMSQSIRAYEAEKRGRSAGWWSGVAFAYAVLAASSLLLGVRVRILALLVFLLFWSVGMLVLRKTKNA
jgi:hypothetical protein